MAMFDTGLSGRLVISNPDTEPWGKLEVPQSLIRGVFDAMNATGLEFPEDPAHITVFTTKELKKIGVENITERGKRFTYRIRSLKRVEPDQWKEMKYVYFLTCSSPELEALRASYGLTPKVHGDHPFHITVGVIPKKTVKSIEKKAADDDEGEKKKKKSKTKAFMRALLIGAGGVGLTYLAYRLLKQRDPQAAEKLHTMPDDVAAPEVPTERQHMMPDGVTAPEVPVEAPEIEVPKGTVDTVGESPAPTNAGEIAPDVSAATATSPPVVEVEHKPATMLNEFREGISSELSDVGQVPFTQAFDAFLNKDPDKFGRIIEHVMGMPADDPDRVALAIGVQGLYGAWNDPKMDGFLRDRYQTLHTTGIDTLGLKSDTAERLASRLSEATAKGAYIDPEITGQIIDALPESDKGAILPSFTSLVENQMAEAPITTTGGILSDKAKDLGTGALQRSLLDLPFMPYYYRAGMESLKHLPMAARRAGAIPAGYVPWLVADRPMSAAMDAGGTLTGMASTALGGGDVVNMLSEVSGNIGGIAAYLRLAKKYPELMPTIAKLKNIPTAYRAAGPGMHGLKALGAGSGAAGRLYAPLYLAEQGLKLGTEGTKALAGSYVPRLKGTKYDPEVYGKQWFDDLSNKSTLQQFSDLALSGAGMTVPRMLATAPLEAARIGGFSGEKALASTDAAIDLNIAKAKELLLGKDITPDQFLNTLNRQAANRFAMGREDPGLIDAWKAKHLKDVRNRSIDY